MLEIRGDVREGLVPSSELESSAGDSNKIYYLVRKYSSSPLLQIGADNLSQIPKSTCQIYLLLFPHEALVISINLGFGVCLISLDVWCIDAFPAVPTLCHASPHADPSFSFRWFSNPCKVLIKLPPAAWFKTPTRLLPCPSKRPTNCARNVSSSGSFPNPSNSF